MGGKVLHEEIFQKLTERLDEIYSFLLKGESNSSQEAELKIEIIDLLSSIQAALISEKEKNSDFIIVLEKAQEAIILWDPFGNWFRQQKQLKELLYDIIVKAKSVVFTNNQTSSSEASRLKKELNSLKSELNDLRSLMKDLAKASTSKIAEERSPEISDEEVEEEISPPIMEPLIPEEEEIVPLKEENVPPLILPIVKEIEPSPSEIAFQEAIEEEEIEDLPLVGQATIDKLSEKQNPETAPANILSQMKSILDEAEEETEKQISSFKEQLSKTEEPKTPALDELEDITQPDFESKRDSEQEPKETLVKPSEMVKLQKSIESTLSSEEDPYMQLLTLEAEKYRLEKEIEKNETDFQEGLKSKLEFDESIQIINKELSIVRAKIEELRQRLTS